MKLLTAVLILSVTVLSVAAWAKSSTTVSVEIVSSDSAPEAQSRYQPSTLQCNNTGCTGGAGHSYSVIRDEVHAKAIINGEKVLLTCGERSRKKACYVLPEGTYQG